MNLKKQIKSNLNYAIKYKDWDEIDSIKLVLDKILTKPDNLILLSDAYKYSHSSFYGSSMTKMVSYLESRGGKFPETVFYGLQILFKKYLEGVAILREEVDEAHEILGTKLGVFGRDDVFDRSKFDYIVDKYGGKLPIRVKAVPEGTVVNYKNVLMTIESLDPECAWLTNFLESLLLQIWYPITVSTLSREVKKIITKSFLTSTSHEGEKLESMVKFVLNDFGFRGVSSVQSAAIGGSANLVNFDGSDTVVASELIREVYNTETIFGKGIPATEHSIMTLKGVDGEVDIMRNVLLNRPNGPVACVSDSYNIFRACKDYWGGELKDLILSRPIDSPLIIRPDSGHVLRTLEEVFKILFYKFSYTTNEKGYKILPPQVRVIQGDGVNLESIGEMYEMLDRLKISPENLALGMGGKLLQGVDRDTNNFATKCCSAVVNGVEVDVVKSPTEMDADGNLTESFKKSKSGKLKLVKTGNTYITLTSKDDGFEEAKDELIEVFNSGVITKEWTFEEIRKRAKINVNEL